MTRKELLQYAKNVLVLEHSLNESDIEALNSLTYEQILNECFVTDGNYYSYNEIENSLNEMVESATNQQQQLNEATQPSFMAMRRIDLRRLGRKMLANKKKVAAGIIVGGMYANSKIKDAQKSKHKENMVALKQEI